MEWELQQRKNGENGSLRASYLTSLHFISSSADFSASVGLLLQEETLIANTLPGISGLTAPLDHWSDIYLPNR